MTAALAYERVRITTIRSTWIMAVLSFLLPFGIASLVVSSSGGQTDPSGQPIEGSVDWLGAFAFPLTLTAILVSVVAAQAIGQEHRFGIIRLTLTTFPRRGSAIAAKIVVVSVASALLTLVSYAASWTALLVQGHPSPAEGAGPDATFFLRGIVFIVLWGLSAFALAGITRQTAIGIAIPIVSGLIVENILGALLSERAEWFVRIMPWSTGSRWATESAEGLGLPVGWAALGVFGIWVAIGLAAQIALFLRRDA
jgi:ABC-2 type transport system permease protein